MEIILCLIYFIFIMLMHKMRTLIALYNVVMILQLSLAVNVMWSALLKGSCRNL